MNVFFTILYYDLRIIATCSLSCSPLLIFSVIFSIFNLIQESLVFNFARVLLEIVILHMLLGFLL